MSVRYEKTYDDEGLQLQWVWSLVLWVIPYNGCIFCSSLTALGQWLLVTPDLPGLIWAATWFHYWSSALDPYTADISHPPWGLLLISTVIILHSR